MRALLLVILGVVVLGAAPASDSIEPGYWESINKVVYPISSTKVDRRCITPKDVAKFLMGPSNHIYACTYPTQALGHGKIEFAGQCVDKKGHKVQLSGHGDYTRTTLNMTADVTFRFMGVPISGEATTQAYRLGDACPPTAR